MITAIVHFPLPAPLTLEEATEVFRSTAPIYRNVPGLVRKVYLLSEDGRTAGGVYLWETRAAAERGLLRQPGQRRQRQLARSSRTKRTASLPGPDRRPSAHGAPYGGTP